MLGQSEYAPQQNNEGQKSQTYAIKEGALAWGL